MRFAFRGPAVAYLKLVLKGTILTILTLGCYYPFFVSQKRAFLVSHIYFGSQGFCFDGRGKELLHVYLKAMLLGIFLFGLALFATAPWMMNRHLGFIFPITFVVLLALSWSYLQAGKQRFFWNHTTFRDSRGHSTVEFDTLLWLKLANLFLLVCSLGLAWPWARVRNIQYAYQQNTLHGPLNLEGIVHSPVNASATGDEMAGWFDVGFDVG